MHFFRPSYFFLSTDKMVRLSPSLNRKPRHDNELGSGGMAPPFLTSAVFGGEWLSLRPSRFNHRQSVSGTHWTGDSVGLTAGMATVN
jgi:hypothetical protein